MWIVWNEGRTEAFVTHDEQLAYEVRKSADTNCVYESGYPAPVAIAFCNKWAEDACEMFPYYPDELALLRAQLAARDAALDAVLALALKQRDGGDMDLERAGEDMCALLLKHGVHPK